MEAAAAQFAGSPHDQRPEGSIQDRQALGNRLEALEQELAQTRESLGSERTGRAVAEHRIEELTHNLNRANAAIEALNPKPDIDLDVPEG